VVIECDLDAYDELAAMQAELTAQLPELFTHAFADFRRYF
jgi:hypothetical protein